MIDAVSPGKYSAARYLRNRAARALAGLCVDCGSRPPRGGSLYCARCGRARVARAAACRERRVLSGKCLDCGEPHAPGAERCERHLRRDRRRYAAGRDPVAWLMSLGTTPPAVAQQTMVAQHLREMSTGNLYELEPAAPVPGGEPTRYALVTGMYFFPCDRNGVERDARPHPYDLGDAGTSDPAHLLEVAGYRVVRP